MYFLDGRPQDDIARVLGTSRSNISRLLASARALGIVEIRIQDEHGRDADLEQALATRFDLAHVRVAAFRPHQDAVAAAGELAAEWLGHTVRDGQVVALSWGTSLQAVVSAVEAEDPRGLEIVPLVGGLATGACTAAGQELVRELADRLGATHRYLHGPALLHSAAARDALLAEPSIGPVLARARSADIAMVGIGCFGAGPTHEVLDGVGLTAAQSRDFLARNPVGDICCRFFDAEGRPIRGVVHDRVLGVDLDDLRRVPTVIGVATGPEKAAGVLAALRGRLVNGLVTDACLAHSVLTADGLL
jgi:DNA-binding transcriptional regulator LsrR (DeoR family)